MVDEPSYRIFNTKPLPTFVEQVREQIRQHGQPELIPDLRHDHIDKSEFFEILAEIDIDPLKRPEGDLAPCPMCQPNKFLGGRLCWFPGIECCAIIGHCCADKDHSAEAERKYKEASVLKWQEDYFLAAFPLVPEKLQKLHLLRPKAEEALRLHRKFRKDANQLMMLLREQLRGDGRLTVHFEIERQAASGEGPQGFRGRDTVFDTHDYGVLAGSVALRASYNPVAELETMVAALAVWNAGTSQEDIIDAIVSMNEAQRQRGYAVLTNVDHRLFPAFQSKLEDFEGFFDPENLRRLDSWGCDHRNPNRVEASSRMLGGIGRQVQISGAGCLTRVVIGEALHTPVYEWPKVPKRK